MRSSLKIAQMLAARDQSLVKMARGQAVTLLLLAQRAATAWTTIVMGSKTKETSVKRKVVFVSVVGARPLVVMENALALRSVKTDIA